MIAVASKILENLLDDSFFYQLKKYCLFSNFVSDFSCHLTACHLAAVSDGVAVTFNSSGGT